MSTRTSSSSSSSLVIGANDPLDIGKDKQEANSDLHKSFFSCSIDSNLDVNKNNNNNDYPSLNSPSYDPVEFSITEANLSQLEKVN